MALGDDPTIRSFGPARFLNRELSWLDFNARVLALAEDSRVPLLERVKFAAIFTGNLDDFFHMVGDKNDSHPLASRPPNDAQQLFVLPHAEHRRWFVEDQYSRFACQRLHNLDQLLIGN